MRAELAGMEAAPTFSLRALVVELQPDLKKARREGHSWKEIAEHFAAVKLDVDPDTLRIYVGKASPTRAARAAKRNMVQPAPPRLVPAAPAVVGNGPQQPPDSNVAPRSDGARIAPRVK